MPLQRDDNLPQHDLRQGHYGELTLDFLPSGSHTGQVVTYVSGLYPVVDPYWGIDYPMLLKDEGTTVGRVYSLNFLGAGVVATLQPSGQASITISGSSGTELTVEEIDGTPSVSPVNTIQFSGGDVYDLGGGIVRVALSGGGGGGDFDISDLTIEHRIEGVDDWVAAYDTSAVDARGFLVGELFMGRGHTVVADDLYFISTTSIYAGGVTAHSNGTGATIMSQWGEDNHPGEVTITTGTTSSGRTALAANEDPLHVPLGSGKVRFGIVARTATASDGTNTYTIRMGLGDTWDGEHVNGVYFRYTHSVNGGEWQGVCRASNTESTLDTNVATDFVFHTFEAEVNADASSVEFFIDGSSKGTITSNIPVEPDNVTFMPATIRKTLGSTSRQMDIDAYWYIMDFATAR